MPTSDRFFTLSALISTINTTVHVSSFSASSPASGISAILNSPHQPRATLLSPIRPPETQASQIPSQTAAPQLGRYNKQDASSATARDVSSVTNPITANPALSRLSVPAKPLGLLHPTCHSSTSENVPRRPTSVPQAPRR